MDFKIVTFGFSTGPGTEAGVISAIGMQYPATGTVRGAIVVETRMLGRDGVTRKTGDVGSLPLAFDPADFAPGALTIPVRTVATDAEIPGQTVDMARLMRDLYSVARHVVEQERARLTAPPPAVVEPELPAADPVPAPEAPAT